MAQLKEIIAAQNQVAPKSDPVLDVLDPKQVKTSLIRLSGYAYHPAYQFEDAFERMTPERAFALLVLANALDDIEPIDVKPPLNLSPAQITELFAAQDKARRKRIERQQKIEADLLAEGRAIVSKYRKDLREHYEHVRTLTGKHRKSPKNFGAYKTLRNRYDRKLNSFTANSEHRDLHASAIEMVFRRARHGRVLVPHGGRSS